MYFLVWGRLHSQTGALVAALLYPLSSASWYWLTVMGMYAQAVPVLFFVLGFLLSDLAVARAQRGVRGRLLDRLLTPAAAVVLALSYQFDALDITSGLSPSDIAPLTRDHQPWGISAPTRGLRLGHSRSSQAQASR